MADGVADGMGGDAAEVGMGALGLREGMRRSQMPVRSALVIFHISREVAFPRAGARCLQWYQSVSLGGRRPMARPLVSARWALISRTGMKASKWNWVRWESRLLVAPVCSCSSAR